MKKVFCLLIVILCVINVNAQCYVFSEKSNQALYLGLDNPLVAFSANTPFKNIEVKTNNGKINKAYSGGLFLYKPDSLGKTTITVYNKKKKLASFFFRVEKLPLPTIRLKKYKNKDSIGINSIPSLKSINAEFTELILCGVRFTIKSFTTLIFRGDSLLHNIKNEGSSFSKETTQAFQNLKVNDRVTFVKVLCDKPDGLGELDDVYFYIKE